ncbi:unnamed protein product [Dicrocoelium dendriticum]|nr:unnamed protein product [Dicrocoelium dendriticum]
MPNNDCKQPLKFAILTTDLRSLKPAFNIGIEKVVFNTTTSAMLSILLYLVITEVATTTGTGTTPIMTAPDSTTKPTDGATKAVIKFPITFLIVIFIFELLVPFD